MTQDEYLQYLIQKANAAVAGGVPQDVVEARLRERMNAAGFATEEPISADTKKAYKDMVVSDLAQDVYKESQVPNSPQQGIFSNVEGGTDVEYYPDVKEGWKRAYLNADKNVAAAFTGGLERAAGGAMGLLAPAASAINSVVWPSMQDAPFEAANALLKEGTEKQRSAVGAAGMVGNVGSALAGGFLTEPMARGMETLNQGGSLLEAEQDAALSSAVNFGGAALGLPARYATGLLGIGKRAAMQIPGSVGLTYAERGLQDEEVTNADLAMAIGGGAFGSLFSEARPSKPSKPKVEDFSTGDPDIDAGINSVLKPDEAVKEITSIDVSKQRPFRETFDPGWRWKSETGPNTNLNIEQTPLDAVRTADEVEAAYAQAARQATDENFLVSDRQQNAQEISRAMFDEEAPPVAPAPIPASRPLATPEMEGLRGELQREAAVTGAATPAQPEGVSVRAVEASPELAPTTSKKLGTQKLSVDAEGNTVPVDLKEIKAKGGSLKDLLEAAEANRNIFQNQRVPFENNASGESSASLEAMNRLRDEKAAGQHRLLIEPNGTVRPLFGVDAVDTFAKPGQIIVQRGVGKDEWTTLSSDPKLSPDLINGRINAARGKLKEAVDDIENDTFDSKFYLKEAVPLRWSEGMSSGKLTFKEVLDDVTTGAANVHPEIAAYAKDLRQLANNLGGDDVRFVPYSDTDAMHKKYSNFKASRGEDVGAAYYSGPEHIIRMDPEAENIHTYLHEGSHAVLSRAIKAGQEGKLSSTSQEAYSRLNDLFEQSRQHIVDRAAPEGVVRDMQTYGASNLQEFVAEVWSNPAFRNHLKSIPLKVIGRKGVVGKIKNMYDAVLNTFGKLLGLSPKATTVLDAVVAQGGDFFRGVNRTETGRSFASDPLAAPKINKQGQQEARGLASQVGRALLNSKGIEPVVTAAGRTRQNIMSVGELEAMQSAARLREVSTDQNKADIDRALSGDKAAWTRLSPEAKAVVKAEYEQNYDRSLEIAKAIAADPNITPQQEGVARAILERAGKYQTRAYQANEIKGYMKDKLALYDKAKAKLAKNEALTAEEAAAHNSVMTARRYLEQSWIPDIDKLERMPTDKLEELYKFHTQLNPDKQFNGFTKEDRRAALKGSVAAKLRQLSDRDAVLDQVVLAAAGLGRKRTGTRAYYQNMRRSQDVYSELSYVPDELKQFWGEITEPVARNIATVRAQYSYLANLHAQNQLRAEGMGKLFSESPSGPHTEGLSGEGFGPLQGLYTSPDVARAMDSVFTVDKTMGDLLDASLSKQVGDVLVHGLREAARPVRFIAGKTKLLSVVYNPGNFVHNFGGSGLQLVSNGNIDPRTYVQGAATMAKIMKAERSSSMDEAVRDAYRYGLVEYSQIEELRKSRANDRIRQYMEEAAGDPVSMAKKVWEGAKEAPELAKELYASMDLYSKFANWHNELDFWVKYNQRKGTGKSLEQIKEEVARRVNDTNITPSMAPRLVKELESVGITRFATYYTEVARTLKNNMFTGLKDMKDATAEGFDPQLFLHGAKRVLGTSASVWSHNAMYAGAAKLGAGALGLAASELAEDDPRKKYMDKDKFLGSIQPLVLEDSDGKQYVYDYSRANPFAPIATPAYKVYEAIAAYANGDEKGAKDKAEQAINNLTGLWSTNTMWKGFVRAVQQQAPSLKRTAEPTYNQLHSQLTEWGLSSKQADSLLSAVEPAAPAFAKNIFASEKIRDKTISNLKAAGVGIQELDITKDLGGFTGRISKQGIQDARADYVDLMKQNYTSSPERLEKGFVSTLKKAAEPYEKLRLATQAAKAQGASRREIMNQLEAAGVSEDMRYTLYNDKPMKVSALKAELDNDFTVDSLATNGSAEEKKEARERFRYNKAEMRRLLKKYKTVNVEEL